MKTKRKKKAKKKARVKNPQILVVTNPGHTKKAREARVKKALKKYREFHDAEPPAMRNIGALPAPDVLISLGHLVEVIYEPNTGTRRRVQWFHKFKSDAVLATDPEGKQLYILANPGDVQVDFSRGIIS